MRKLLSLAASVLLIFIAASSYAETAVATAPTTASATTTATKPVTAESVFKSVAQKIAALDQKAIKAGKTGPDWAEKSQKYRKSLKAIVKADPKSKWADDAQYLVGVLSEADKLDIPEKEFFLKTFPDGKAEEWTQEKLGYIVPTKLSLDLSVRMDLCLAYIRVPEKEKLKTLVTESSAKYPERELFFKTLLKKSESIS